MRAAPGPLPPDARTFVADRGDEGQRLDVVLTRHLAGVRTATRTRVQRWVEDGRVRVNGRVTVRPARHLHAGEQVEVELPWRRSVADHLPEDVALEVLFEDDHLLIVSKPAGMLAHPTGRHRTGTLFNALLWRARTWPDASTPDASTSGRPGLVHRLDRDTSGVIVVAKSRAVHARTVRLLRDPHARKQYLAVVSGRPPAHGVISIPLMRVSDRPPRMAPAPEGGLSCETRYEVLSSSSTAGRTFSLVACTLMTGRLHQIRAHLQAAGWPIVGDSVYGGQPLEAPIAANSRPPTAAIDRQALHAWRLSLPHPVTGEILHVEASVPDDMQRLIDATFSGNGVPSPGGDARGGS